MFEFYAKASLCLLASFLTIAYVRPSSTHAQSTKESKVIESRITCKMVLTNSRGKIGQVPFEAEVEIKNDSKEAIDIEYTAMPFYFLDLRVFDPNGKKISIRPYRLIYSISDKDQHILKPGETYRASVNIQANSELDSWRVLGVYKIAAVFEYKNLKTESPPVELTLDPN